MATLAYDWCDPCISNFPTSWGQALYPSNYLSYFLSSNSLICFVLSHNPPDLILLCQWQDGKMWRILCITKPYVMFIKIQEYLGCRGKGSVYVKALALTLCGKSLSSKVTMPKCSQCIVSESPLLPDRICICFWAPHPLTTYLTNICGKLHEKGELGTWIYSHVFLTNVACGGVFIYLAFCLLESMIQIQVHP